MNRFARPGETADPCGVPFSRSTRVPSGRCSGRQPPLHIQQHPATVGDRLDRPDYEVPRHGVEELLDIQVDDPVELPAPAPTCLNRVKGRLFRPVAIGVGMEHRFHQLLEILGRDRLSHPVGHRGHAEHADPAATRLGYLHCPDRGRKVRPQLIDSRSCTFPSDRPRTRPTSGRPHPGHPCWPQPAYTPPTPSTWKSRTACPWTLALFFSLPPRPPAPVERNDIPGEPAPWLHPHPSEQAFRSYYEPVRQLAPRRYSVPSVAALDPPLATLGPRPVNGHRFLPTGGHLIPHWWPSFLPAGGHQISPPVAIVSPQQGVGLGSGEGLHPLAGGRLGEPVAVLAVGDDHVGVMQ